MTSVVDQDRPLEDTMRSPSAKPEGGVRILSFFLQAFVMAAALFLFFLFAGIAAVVLLHLFVVGRALRRRSSRSRFLNPNPTFDELDNSNVPVGISVSDLRKMDSFEYSRKNKSMKSADGCAICLEVYRDGERVREMATCGHGFHKDCVDRWLVKSRACPICRRSVLKQFMIGLSGNRKKKKAHSLPSI